MIEPIGDSERIIIVANRLSVSASITENAVEFSQSMGGLATGLSSLQEYYQMLWVGWCGIPREEMSDEQHALIEQRLKDEYRSIAVDLTQEEVQQFYLGFCNNTIWPLFHYFPTYVDYSHENFATYERVNQAYFERLRPHIRPDDIIWVHDYQLMLLPQYIRDEFPDVRIGFFLHIPFPSYEMFRLLPWRRELMDGVLGADLVGFHTYDYARHFLSAVRRIVGLDNHLGRIALEGRTIGVDVFPMGIDYERYAKASQQPEVMEFIDKIDGSLDEQHLILSVDRLDYSKGIPNRLWGYRYFLEQHPEWHGRVSLAMIVAPSREGVPQYQDLKREVDELISDINGTFSTLD
ncbi:MAG: bifunctional alpha,alpha-trehalose-phosphate synthase (UDP-forming)/trehalose-phosphatase, partial [Spirochaetaceae bacterium]